MSTDEHTLSPFGALVRERTPRFATSLRFIASIVFEQKALLVGSFMLLLLSSFAMVIGPRLLGVIVDEVSGHGNRQTLFWLCLLFPISEAVRLLSSAAQSYFIARLGQRSLHSLRCRVFDHIERLPMGLHNKAKTGELITYLSNDVQALSDMFSAGFMVVVEKLFVVIFTVSSLILLDSTLALLGLGLFVILLTIATYFASWLKRSYRVLRETNSEFNAILSENIEGVDIIRYNGFESYRIGIFDECNERLRRAQIEPVKVFGVFHPAMTLVNALSIALLGIWGGELVISGKISLGMLVAAFGYVLWLFWPIIIIVDRWNTFLNGLSATERLAGVLSLEAEVINPSAALPSIKGEIVFENVWFAYVGEQWVLKDLSMTIPAGKRVAFFGPTGSGKTTLTSLLLRLYEPQRGRILIDGIDIKTIELSTLRRFFGVVQQDATLYRGTVSDNITLFDENVALKRVRTLGRLNLEGEASTSLSMGERQLVAFERARYSSPALWILDEATAHLDPELDRELEVTLLQESKGHTAIVIAHRLSSLSLVDCIFVLHGGALIEEGSHAELLKKDGFYARYVSIQEKLQTESL